MKHLDLEGFLAPAMEKAIPLTKKVFAKHGLECPVDEAVEAAMRAYPKQAGALCAQWDAYGAKCAAPTVNHGDMRVRRPAFRPSCLSPDTS